LRIISNSAADKREQFSIYGYPSVSNHIARASLKGKKAQKREYEVVEEGAFKFSLNEDQPPFKHMAPEVYKLYRKQAEFEYNITNKINTIEEKIDKLLKGKP
jgi:hypothetical protein